MATLAQIQLTVSSPVLIRANWIIAELLLRAVRAMPASVRSQMANEPRAKLPLAVSVCMGATKKRWIKTNLA
jgi:hypothetical protein